MDIEELNKHIIVSFNHGSYVYGTNNEHSDKDIVCIIDNDIDLSAYQQNIYEYKDESTNIDYQYINDKTFKQMIYDHHIVAIESMWMSEDNYSDYNLFQEKYAKYFILDKYKLRATISSICSNAWVKCKKKLIIADDYDWYRAVKSLFHSIRLYMFGIQIARFGKIISYSEANTYWQDIYDNGIHKEWQDYYDKYKPIYNYLHTEFAKICPKKL